MRPETTAQAYAVVAKAYNLKPDPDAVEVWHGLLSDPALELSDAAVLLAVKRLCQRSPYAVNCADLIAEAQSISGKGRPTPIAAEGYFLAGHWEVHPAVERAARQVYFDRNAEPRAAAAQFRSLYAAELDADDRQEAAAAALPHPRPLLEVLGGDDEGAADE